METKHTPGPWEMGEVGMTPVYAGMHNGCFIYPKSNNKELISFVAATQNEQAKANASLIAAAPDLLEALELIMNKNSSNFRLKAPDYLIDKIDAAISKAKGEK